MASSGAIRSAAAHPLARLVKIADLEDSCDTSRIARPSERDIQRLARYRRALALIDALPPPDPG